MRIRTAASAAVVTAVALLTLTACSDDKNSSSPASSAPAATTGASTDDSDQASDSGGSSGIDPETQALLIASLQKIDPSLAENPEQTAASAQEQCAALANDADPTGHAAAQKFSTPDHQLTDPQGQAINAALNALVCEPDLGG